MQTADFFDTRELFSSQYTPYYLRILGFKTALNIDFLFFFFFNATCSPVQVCSTLLFFSGDIRKACKGPTKD